MRRVWIAAALLTALTARADPAFDVGMEAYRAGDFPAAAGHWRPLAEQGDATRGALRAIAASS